MRKKRRALLWALALIFIAVAVFFAPSLSVFERNAPQIMVDDVLYTDLKSPVLVHIKDEESGVKNIKITLKKDSNDSGVILADEKVGDKKDLSLQINLPKAGFKENIKSYTMEIWAKDSSLWNLGNESKKQILVIVDTLRPRVNVLSNSRQIEQGGAASVVFGASDENLAEVYIQTDKNKIFKATPYLKEGYYAALVAWDAKDEDFAAFIVAKDRAGNLTKERIRYYLLNRKYRLSNIKLSDKFLDGKIENLATQYAPQGSNLTRFEKFKFVNETLRDNNEKLIHKISSEVLEKKLEKFELNLFLPLKNAMKVADFADHRYYSYEEQFISDSYHMGLDLASVAQAPIISNNAGKVVFAGENGIYGLNLLLYHGFGIYSLYGHCSSKSVEVGDEVGANSIIAQTGLSGLALGDHLHFGVLVQGVETRPEQWQDKKWLENNIYRVLNDGKKAILGGK